MFFHTPLFTLLLSCVTLQSLVSAAAIPASDIDTHTTAMSSANPAVIFRRDVPVTDPGSDYNRCGHSDFYNLTTNNSPLVSDCNCIIQRMHSVKGYYRTGRSPDNWVKLVSCGTCAFGVRTSNIWGTRVGNTDISDLIRDSINQYASNGRVEARGRMSCHNGVQNAGTPWTIYRS